MRTGSISASTGKGRHVTSHRELVVLEGGAILIDNPGMREVGIADAEGGLETTFDRLLAFAETCRFRDCSHTTEAGCAGAGRGGRASSVPRICMRARCPEDGGGKPQTRQRSRQSVQIGSRSTGW